MMRIGILTFHDSINNGAVIQCYSLSKRIKNEFPEAEVEVIDYRMPKVNDFYTVSLRRYLRGGSIVVKGKKLVKLLLNPNYFKWQRERKRAFESCREYLPLSKETIYDDGVGRLFEYMNENYDVVVAGSDAIWNYNLRGFPNPYFLDSGVTSLKFSYAASCYGMNYENIPSDQKEKIKKILDSYQFIGVRDGESEKFAKQMGCSVEPVHTCDPTVFLDVNDLPIDEEALLEKLKKKGFDFAGQTIGIMGDDHMCNMVRKMFGKKYQIVALYNYCKGADVNLYDLTPYEWAYVFRLFKVTVTTFFHGTLLSLRNGTPVVCIALATSYSKNHTTKVEDVLRRVDMSDCYFVTDYKNQNYEEIKNKIEKSIKADLKDTIVGKMDKEAETSKVFIDTLREQIK